MHRCSTCATFTYERSQSLECCRFQEQPPSQLRCPNIFWCCLTPILSIEHICMCHPWAADPQEASRHTPECTVSGSTGEGLKFTPVQMMNGPMPCSATIQGVCCNAMLRHVSLLKNTVGLYPYLVKGCLERIEAAPKGQPEDSSIYIYIYILYIYIYASGCH